MKRILSILVLVLAVSFQTNAQERKRQHRQNQDLTAEQTATLGSKKMTLNLDLTAAQEKQVYSLLETQAAERIEMRAKRKEMKENNQTPTDEEKYNFRVAQLDKQISFKQEMKQILNDEQYDKWSKTMDRAKNKRSKKGQRHNGNRAR